MAKNNQCLERFSSNEVSTGRLRELQRLVRHSESGEEMLSVVTRKAEWPSKGGNTRKQACKTMHFCGVRYAQ